MTRLIQVRSTLTRPANTTAYAQNDLIADNATAGSIIVPSLSLTPRRTFELQQGFLYTNLTTGFTTFAGHIDLWTTAPTFTNGDNGAYAVATGAAGWIGHLTSDVVGTFNQFADGPCAPVQTGDTYSSTGAFPHCIVPSSEGEIFWTLRETDATGFTPISGQIFTLVLCFREYT
jgi:hypothetical protein